MDYHHIPVMLSASLGYLSPQAGQKFIDCTLGGAGYTIALAKAVGATGRIMSFDLDPLALENAQKRITEEGLSNITLIRSNFKYITKAVADNFPAGTKFAGIVFDLGLSSAQLDDQSRGFSFQGDRPLNMAFDPDDIQGSADQTSTEKIVNSFSLPELTTIFREYGEEKYAYKIAKAIIAARRLQTIRTTAELVAIIESAVPPRFYHHVHPATRVFQALRLATNHELESLAQALPEALELLEPGGRLVVVSFHSGEDRIVKRFFREQAAGDQARLTILTKKPLVPTDEESASNPRARSAKLRAAQKIS